MTLTSDAELTRDAFLGGRLQLWQPRDGYRAGVDPVLLGASVPAKPGQTLLDLGCGAGAAALCVGARVPEVALTGVERQPAYAALARRNGLSCIEADLSALPEPLKHQAFDHVIANPPYFDRGAGHAARDAGREGAMGQDTPLSDWVQTAAKRLKPKGYLHLIHRIEAMPELLAVASGLLGSLEIKPLAAREGRPADRLILRARKEGRAAFRLHQPLILHAKSHHERDEEDYAPDVRAALRDAAALIW